MSRLREDIVETLSEQPSKVLPKTVQIKADDASYTHGCGVMVSPNFSGSGIPVYCPRCRQTV